jgi:hypothetical protein
MNRAAAWLPGPQDAEVSAGEDGGTAGANNARFCNDLIWQRGPKITFRKHCRSIVGRVRKRRAHLRHAKLQLFDRLWQSAPREGVGTAFREVDGVFGHASSTRRTVPTCSIPEIADASPAGSESSSGFRIQTVGLG